MLATSFASLRAVGMGRFVFVLLALVAVSMGCMIFMAPNGAKQQLPPAITSKKKVVHAGATTFDDDAVHRQTTTAMAGPTTTATSVQARDGGDSNNHTNLHNNDDDDTLRLCRLPQIPRLNEPKVRLAQLAGNLDVGYQCAGSDYDRCVAAFQEFARRKIHNNNNSTWGRQGVPFLGRTDNHGDRPNGTTVLFLGNSNTRQIVEALLCQYSDDIVQVNATFVALRNNVTLYHSTNQFYHHLPNQWDIYLQQHTLGGRPLQSLDAVVLGDFNVPQRTRSSNFYRTVTQRAMEEGVAIDEAFTPTIDVVARRYTNGPIVYVSDVRSTTVPHPTAQRLQSLLQREQPQRTNVVAMAGGRYVSQIGPCLARDNQNVGPAYNSGHGHRCTGRGGHADLLAWDVAELLHELLVVPGE